MLIAVAEEIPALRNMDLARMDNALTINGSESKSVELRLRTKLLRRELNTVSYSTVVQTEPIRRRGTMLADS